ncbi:hypothetical protein SAMN05443549_107140 [Flavobacterium fluvii]|uniref:Uncharacterized protein n=1 Tax=Flavobacterium fluvii TaxID=468056 RepID=A0A1M5N7Q2_9FLAO|nr:hypothetical protein SAMN05443549_107140 [Flavobacterium fluvii]
MPILLSKTNLRFKTNYKTTQKIVFLGVFFSFVNNGSWFVQPKILEPKIRSIECICF